MSSNWKPSFLSGKSTVGALLSATHEWFTLLEEGPEVATVFFYLTKAFDSASTATF